MPELRDQIYHIIYNHKEGQILDTTQKILNVINGIEPPCNCGEPSCPECTKYARQMANKSIKQAVNDFISATEKIRNGNDLDDEVMQPIYDALLNLPTMIRKEDAQKYHRKLKSRIRELLYLLKTNQPDTCYMELDRWLKDIEDGDELLGFGD